MLVWLAVDDPVYEMKNRVLLCRGPIFQGITYVTAMTELDRRSDFKSHNAVTPYLALTGELWCVCCKDIGEIGCVITAPHCMYSDDMPMSAFVIPIKRHRDLKEQLCNMEFNKKLHIWVTKLGEDGNQFTY